jgi:hypothetical protein
MIKRLANIVATALIVGAVVLFSSAYNAAAQEGVQPANIVTIEGIVESVEMGISQEFPTFTLALPGDGKVTVVTGPYYILLDKGFEIRVGDRMAVKAFRSLWYENTYVAVELSNLTTGETLVLRDETGRPLWTNRGKPGEPGGPGNGGYGGGNGAGNGGPGSGGDQQNGGPANIITLEGVVVTVDMVCGDHYPSFTIAKSDGTKVVVMTGPYRYLVENSFSITIGDSVVVEAIVSLWHDGAYVAIEISNVTTGAVILLRDEDAKPLWTSDGAGGKGDCDGWIPPSLGPSDIIWLEGVVIEVKMACGEEFPSFDLALGDGSIVTIKTGPYYILLENGFEIRTGDRMSVKAFRSMWYESTYVAVELMNLTTGETLVLRDGTGKPAWTGWQELGDKGLGYGGGAAWLDADPDAIDVHKGKVESINPGMGDGYPSFTLVKSNGKRLTVMLGPNYFMLQHRFELRVGDRVKTWVFASGWFEKIYVGMKVKNQTRGDKVTLREQNGRPLWERIN